MTSNVHVLVCLLRIIFSICNFDILLCSIYVVGQTCLTCAATSTTTNYNHHTKHHYYYYHYYFYLTSPTRLLS